MRLQLLAAAALAALLHGNAHAAMVEVAGRGWNCDDGVSVTDTVATVSTVGAAKKSVSLTTQIDVSAYLESGVEWQVRVRGRGIKKPTKSYLGVKAMLVYDEPSGERRYPGPIGRTGDFDWITVRYRTAFRNGVRGNTAKLVLGLQETEGEVEYDLSSLRIAAATTQREQIDETRKCRYTPRVADMPQQIGRAHV